MWVYYEDPNSENLDQLSASGMIKVEKLQQGLSRMGIYLLWLYLLTSGMRLLSDLEEQSMDIVALLYLTLEQRIILSMRDLWPGADCKQGISMDLELELQMDIPSSALDI